MMTQRKRPKRGKLPPNRDMAVRLPDAVTTYNEHTVATVLVNLVDRHKHKFTPEASNGAFEAFFVRRLLSSDIFQSSEDAIFITRLARNGHPAAQAALATAIRTANRLSRWDDLPLAVRAYNDELVTPDRGATSGQYSSQAGKVVNNYVRDIHIGMLVEVVRAKLPHLPRYNSKKPGGQLSAMGLLAVAFGLSEIEIYRIHKRHRNIPQLVQEFFRDYAGPLSIG